VQYTVTYSCDHTGTVNLFGPGRERERKLAWLETVLCPACAAEAKAKQNAAASEKAGREAAANGLPVLQGSEKQCAWAETLRAERMAKVTEMAERLQPKVEGDGIGIVAAWKESPFDPVSWLALADWFEEKLPEQSRTLEEKCRARGDVSHRPSCWRAIAWMIRQSEAKWWIDNRYHDFDAMVERIADEPEKIRREQAERARKEAEAKAQEEKEKEELRRLWEEKDRIATFFHSVFGDLVHTVEVWNRSDKRLYFGRGCGANAGCYYSTGNGSHRPETLHLMRSDAKERAAGREEEVRAFCAEMCKVWKSITVEIDTTTGKAKR